jgi:hypothetical protein
MLYRIIILEFTVATDITAQVLACAFMLGTQDTFLACALELGRCVDGTF